MPRRKDNLLQCWSKLCQQIFNTEARLTLTLTQKGLNCFFRNLDIYDCQTEMFIIYNSFLSIFAKSYHSCW